MSLQQVRIIRKSGKPPQKVVEKVVKPGVLLPKADPIVPKHHV